MAQSKLNNRKALLIPSNIRNSDEAESLIDNNNIFLEYYDWECDHDESDWCFYFTGPTISIAKECYYCNEIIGRYDEIPDEIARHYIVNGKLPFYCYPGYQRFQNIFPELFV